MNDYGQINNLWEKSLENFSTFSKTFQEEASKAMTNQTNTYIEGVNVGVNLAKNTTAEITKNMTAVGEMWGNAIQATMNHTSNKAE